MQCRLQMHASLGWFQVAIGSVKSDVPKLQTSMLVQAKAGTASLGYATAILVLCYCIR